jgi:hypothetical protein
VSSLPVAPAPEPEEAEEQGLPCPTRFADTAPPVSHWGMENGHPTFLTRAKTAGSPPKTPSCTFE